MNIDELVEVLEDRSQGWVDSPLYEAAQLLKQLKKYEAAGGEPFWYAVVSDKAPVVNKALRSLEVAEEYAAKSSDAYPGVHVVPLYARPDPRVVELEGIIRHASQVKTLDDNLIAELEAQIARLTELNSQLCAKSNSYVIYNARLEEQIAALLVAIEAKDAVLNTCLEMFDPEFGSSHLNRRLLVQDIKMAISPSTDLLETRDRKRDAVPEDIRKDAERYLWLKSQKGLALSSCGGSWIKGNIKFNASHRLCANGTAYAPYETLDEAIDAAIAAAPELGD